LNVKPATKVPFCSRLQDHLVDVTRFDTPGNGSLMDETMNAL
jgi:hypothetical protein